MSLSSRLVIDNLLFFRPVEYVRESHEALVDIFECIDNILSRLYTKIKPTSATTEMVIKMMVELLSLLVLRRVH